MLLDLRVVLAAIMATVLLLIAGFSLIAGVRSPLKPSIGFTIGGPPEARALNLPAPAQSKPLQVRNRAPEDSAPVNEKSVAKPAPDSAPAKTKSANIVPHEQSTLTDTDKGLAAPGPTTRVVQKPKAKKKVHTAIKSAPKPANTFTFGQ